ncbi:hypothetical protein KAH55_12015 [bacterium]|nr:hypothetical protein [bacterium]
MIATTIPALAETTPSLRINELNDVILSLVSEYGLDLAISEQEHKSTINEFSSWIYYMTLPINERQ